MTMLIEYIKTGSSQSKKKIRKKRGIMTAYQSLGKVFIGFSLCHSHYDTFDVVGGFYTPGHGAKISIARASKWVDESMFSIKKKKGFSQIVAIPHSIRNRLHKFIIRTSLYYKDKQLPVWATEFRKHMDNLPNEK
jgi:hypothetical protein